MTRVGFLAASIVFIVACSAFPWFSRGYTANGLCQDQNYVDPVNLVFDGTYSTVSNTLRGMANHNNWTHTDGSSQNLAVATSLSTYRCDSMGGQRASSNALSTRFHGRIWGIPAASGRLVAGSAHHEDWVGSFQCPPFGGHAVDSNGSNGSGFDQGRAKLVDGWQAHGHSAHGELWGNSRNFQQCDGDWAGSNGVGVVLNQPHVHG